MIYSKVQFLFYFLQPTEDDKMGKMGKEMINWENKHQLAHTDILWWKTVLQKDRSYLILHPSSCLFIKAHRNQPFSLHLSGSHSPGSQNQCCFVEPKTFTWATAPPIKQHAMPLGSEPPLCNQRPRSLNMYAKSGLFSGGQRVDVFHGC